MKKLFFLLSESPTSFNEDDDKFRTFFESRYNSFDMLRKKTPRVFRETMEWLNSEVFIQCNNEGEEGIDEEQCAFEEELHHAIVEASGVIERQRRVAISHFHGIPEAEEGEEEC
jgi:CHAD domain-containing protein